MRGYRSLVTAGAAAIGAAVLVSTLGAAPAPQATSAAPGLKLPLRLTAFAINMSTAPSPRKTEVVDLRITRWSDAKEREGLIVTAVEKGPDQLLRALQKLPKSGRISIPGWQGPDPHNARLGWELHYAATSPLDGGGNRIVVMTDRYIGFWEARNQPRTTDYPFTLIEIQLDASGKGTGKMAVATKIEYDKKKNQMVLENYSSEPVRLNEVKIDS